MGLNASNVSASSSAGALVAALVAAGYHGDPEPSALAANNANERLAGG